MAYIEGVNREQRILFPEYVDDYISSDNPVRVIEEYVNTLNLKLMGFTKTEVDRSGAPGYNPKDILKLYMYGFNNTVRSSRKLEKETHRNIEVIWLLKKLCPDFKTIADFRKENKEQIKKVFKDFSLLCKELGLYSEDTVAVDGTKIKANNSKKNNYTTKKIDRQIKYYDEKIDNYLQAMDECDKSEESQEIQKNIQEKLALIRERKAKYDEMKKTLEETGVNEISTVDKDARLMDNKNNGLEMAYNVQIVADGKNHLVMDYAVTMNASDHGNLNKMSNKAREVLGKECNVKLEVLADKGYYKTEDIIESEMDNNIAYVPKQNSFNSTGDREFYSDRFQYNPEKDIYICPVGQELNRVKHRKENPDRVTYHNGTACKKCPYLARCTTSKKGRRISRGKHQNFLDKFDARTKENMDKYKQRQSIVEHPFGTIKRAMNAGYFLTRGLSSVEAETALVMVAYNIKRTINILGVKELIERIRVLRPQNA